MPRRLLRRHRPQKHDDPRRQTAPGSAPGIVSAPENAKPTEITLIAYDEVRLEERVIDDVAEARAFLDGDWPVVWLNVVGLGDSDALQSIGEMFELHPLAMEDVTSLHQRPKVEPYSNCMYLVFRQPHLADDGTIESEQVSVFIGEHYVVTFQEHAGDAFEPVRHRIRAGRARMRNAGPDYLAYALTDAVIDTHFPLLERLSDQIEDLEHTVILEPSPDAVPEIYALKRQLLSLRRATWPLRDAIGTLVRNEDNDLIREPTRVFFRDCQDHAVQIVELVENYRETATSLLDVYLSSLSNRMNEVMKVLTIIATIFIPLGFVAGVYGMNFERDHPLNMPELGWAYGYPAVMIFMGLVTLGLLLYFRHKRWIGPP